MNKDKQRLYISNCPRDAMQGIKSFIKTPQKIDYLQSLLGVNFELLDCGSFVSPRIIPQMADTAQVLAALDKSKSNTKISVIIANRRGAELALQQKNVDFLGFPFSISETFQQKNTNATRLEGLERIEIIQDMMRGSGKNLLVYLSMAFGNRYGEDWSLDLLLNFVEKIVERGVYRFNVSDTVGVATPHQIQQVFLSLKKNFPKVHFGAHLHTIYNQWYEKIDAAYQGGCTHFDGAIHGFGGCPMADSPLMGNMPTEKLINYAQLHQLNHELNLAAFEGAFNNALTLFRGQSFAKWR